MITAIIIAAKKWAGLAAGVIVHGYDRKPEPHIRWSRLSIILFCVDAWLFISLLLRMFFVARPR